MSTLSTIETLRAARRSSSGVSTSSVLSVSSAALSQAISSIDNGKNAIVVDIGSKLTKLGCAGETYPRHILLTEFDDEAGRKVTSEEIFSLNNRKSVILPQQQAEDILVKFFRHLFLKVLAPNDRPLIIVESVFMSIAMRNAIAKAVLEKLRCKSIMFMPSHVCCTFPFNTQNALVVDIGYSELMIIPVIEGVTMLSSHRSTRSICGKELENRVRKLLKKYGRVENMNGERIEFSDADWLSIDDVKLCETIILNLVCVDKDRAQKWKLYDNGETDKLPVPSITDELIVSINGKTVVIPSVVIETSVECMFDEEYLSSNSFDSCLQHIMLSITGNCPIDIRKMLFSNILLVGGMSTIPGFAARLKAELRTLSDIENKKIAEDVKFYQFKELQNFPIFASWLGASMLGSLRETVERRSITVEEWNSGKTPENWSEF